MNTRQIAIVYFFCSSSNPDVEYQTLLYTDGTLSCECPGWTRRCVNGVRTCKHVRAIEAGATSQAARMVDYRKFPVGVLSVKTGKPVQQEQPELKPGGRRFDFSL